MCHIGIFEVKPVADSLIYNISDTSLDYIIFKKGIASAMLSLSILGIYFDSILYLICYLF